MKTDIVNQPVGGPGWCHLAALAVAGTPMGEVDIASHAVGASLAGNPNAAAMWEALEIGRVMRDCDYTYPEAQECLARVGADRQRQAVLDAEADRHAAALNVADRPVERWHERKTIVLDFETTSPDPLEARVVTASLIERYGIAGEPGGGTITREWTVNAGVEISPESTAIHGVSNQTVRTDGLPLRYVIEAILRLLRDAIAEDVPVIAFNGSYDMTVLDREAERLGIDVADRIGNDTLLLIDALVLDRTINRFAPGKRTLGHVVSRLGLPAFDAHNSTADCLATAKIVDILVAQKPELLVHPRRLTIWCAQWHAAADQRMRTYIRSQGGVPDDRPGYGVHRPATAALARTA